MRLIHDPQLPPSTMLKAAKLQTILETDEDAKAEAQAALIDLQGSGSWATLAKAYNIDLAKNVAKSGDKLRQFATDGKGNTKNVAKWAAMLLVCEFSHTYTHCSAV